MVKHYLMVLKALLYKSVATTHMKQMPFRPIIDIII